MKMISQDALVSSGSKQDLSWYSIRIINFSPHKHLFSGLFFVSGSLPRISDTFDFNLKIWHCLRAHHVGNESVLL